MRKIIFLLLFLFKPIFLEEVFLPKPIYKGNFSFEELIYRWKATRKFSEKSLTQNQLSQLLWAAAGLTVDGVSSATRVFPSAGAIYPLEIYIICGKIEKINPGIYRYNPNKQSLILIKQGDFRSALEKMTYNQLFVSQAPLSVIWVGNYEKVSWYGERGKTRYIHIDLGHSAQNLTLQCLSLGLGTVQIGAFNDSELNKLLNLNKEESALYIMPVGYPK
ncbi:MAG: SagB/ThcOx family dehydrogenase [Endomicrobia bacterium]|nr:SagB/ThcOx family dehydrogenase [Endomicrobiia bacterium]